MRSRQSRSSATWPSRTSLTFTTAATWTTPTVRTASDSFRNDEAYGTGSRWVLGGPRRSLSSEWTANYKSMAMSYAAYRVLLDLFPTKPVDFAGFMTGLGYDPTDASTDTSTPQGIGNMVAQAVLDFRHRDGSNQLGDANGGAPYSDYTG